MNILQNISFCVLQKKESHTTLEQNTVDCENIKNPFKAIFAALCVCQPSSITLQVFIRGERWLDFLGGWLLQRNSSLTCNPHKESNIQRAGGFPKEQRLSHTHLSL